MTSSPAEKLRSGFPNLTKSDLGCTEDQQVGRPQRELRRRRARRVIDPREDVQALRFDGGLEPLHRLFRPVVASQRDNSIRGRDFFPGAAFPDGHALCAETGVGGGMFYPRTRLDRRVLAWPKQVAEIVPAWFKRQTAELG